MGKTFPRKEWEENTDICRICGHERKYHKDGMCSLCPPIHQSIYEHEFTNLDGTVDHIEDEFLSKDFIVTAMTPDVVVKSVDVKNNTAFIVVEHVYDGVFGYPLRKSFTVVCDRVSELWYIRKVHGLE